MTLIPITPRTHGNTGRTRPDLQHNPGRPKGIHTPRAKPQDLPNAMRFYRLAKGMTLDEAGAAIAMRGAGLGKIELGKVQIYAVDALALARVYGVTVEQLLGPSPQ